jgi:hypothetical protein
MTRFGLTLVLFLVLVGSVLMLVTSGDNGADHNVPGATTTSGRNSITSPER